MASSWPPPTRPTPSKRTSPVSTSPPPKSPSCALSPSASSPIFFLPKMPASLRDSDVTAPSTQRPKRSQGDAGCVVLGRLAVEHVCGDRLRYQRSPPLGGHIPPQHPDFP